MRFSFGLLWVLWCVVQGLAALAFPRHVAAQDEEPAGYRELIDEALGEYREHHYPEARALFVEAHAKWPTARTARALGMAAFELRDYPECILYLEKALASTVRPLDPELHEKTEALLARAYRLVARVHVELLPNSAQTTVDGEPVTLTAHVPLVLAPGAHELAFRAEGHEPEERTLNVNGGEQEHWRIALTPSGSVPSPREVAQHAAATEPTRSARADESPRKKPLYKNPWLWSGVGAAVVAGAVAIAVSVTAGRDARVVTDRADPSAFTAPGGEVVVP